jgi:hypothetical protein
VLAGAWRPGAPSPDVSAEALARVAPLLHQTGSGALAWWALRRSPLAGSETVEGFHQAYRLHALEAEVHALRATDALGRLADAGVEALLVKGWAIARHYPEVGLRPYTDLDLIVRPGQAGAVRAALAAPPRVEVPVDLHDGPARLDAASFDALAARAQVAELGSRPVRVLGPEDHLRLLAHHALGHGLFRPLWLVDLAVALEARPAGFDWVRCLGNDPRRADWVTCALALAGRLLGARLESTPAAARAGTLPAWLGRAVLRNWARGTGTSHLPPVFQALAAELRHPARAWAEVRRRWDRPIEATMEVGGAFGRGPRWPYQVAAAAGRAPELWRALRNRHPGAGSPAPG